uniref:UDP-glucuronosyltransferase 2B20 n=1 Tax=Lygus hesperus TaxID=30085 RepID=A0A0A9Z0Z0_LYGHE
MFLGYLAVIILVSVACEGAEILGILPHPGKSHNLVTTPYFLELARRGHSVTVLGYYKPDNAPSNYRTVLLGPEGAKSGYYSFDILDHKENFAVWNMQLFLDLAQTFSPAAKRVEALKSQLKSKYDLIVVEFFNAESFLGFVESLGAPFIYFHTAELIPWQWTAVGDPLETSYNQNVYTELGRKADFKGRLYNFLETYWLLYFYQTTLRGVYETSAGSSAHPLLDIAKNASLQLVNTHFSFTGSRPVNPSTIEVGGINVPPAKPLPQDIQTLMDSSKNGVIFFSMGSVIRGSSLDTRRRDMFLKVFSELKETVLWKWESDDLPNKPVNVFTSAWFPQRDIFAHPNLKLYIGHCGLLGVHEAVTEAVPTICLPMFADQNFNAQRLKEIGMGFGLDLQQLNENTLGKAVREVLEIPTYKENAIRVSKAFLDRPMSPMDTAMYWTEYVIRHNGAFHLKSPARYMNWIEYYNMDIISLIVSLMLFIIYLIYKMIKAFICTVMPRKKVKIN